MISQLRTSSRSRSDSRPRPIQVPGRSTRVRSLIDFYNQKALQKATAVTSRPYHDRDRIPSDKVRSLVQNFSRAASAASRSGPSSRGGGIGMPRDGTSSPVLLRSGMGVVRGGAVSPAAVRREEKVVVERVVEMPRRGEEVKNSGLRTVQNWKSGRAQKVAAPVMVPNVEEPVARKRRKSLRRTSVVNMPGAYGEPLPLNVQPLTAPVLRALESEITRSSSLEMEISASPGDVISDAESAASQTSESSSKKFREQRKIGFKAVDIPAKPNGVETNVKTTATVEREAVSQKTPSVASRRSGSWKGALKNVRDSLWKKQSTTESLSTKVSDESATYKQISKKSLIDNLTPDSPAATYLAVPEYVPEPVRAAVPSPISHVHAHVPILETVNSESENENILPSDTEARKTLGKVDVDRVLQEVSGPSVSQPVEDPNTISGTGEMISWESTIARQKRRARTQKSGPKQRIGERRPVAGVFRSISPVKRRESPLKPVSPLRVIKDKTQTTDQEANETLLTVPPKSEPGALLTRVSMDTLTSFKELSLPGSLGSSVDTKDQAQVGKPLGPLALAQSRFESLSDLTSPPPSRPPQEVRSPTIMREIAFPSLSLRESAGDAKDSFDTLPIIDPIPRRQNSVPRKRIFGDADWRTDRRASGGSYPETNRRLQEFQESSVSSYDGQTSGSMYVDREHDFKILPRQNYIPTSESGLEEYGDMIEAPFLKYTINPPPPAGTPPGIYPFYQSSRGFTPRSLTEGTSVIEVGADGQDEIVTRGRRKRRIGS